MQSLTQTRRNGGGPEGRHQVVVSLGLSQTLAWASSYYLPAVLAGPMSKDLGVSAPTVFAAFSVALFVSALIGPLAGRAIDRWGGSVVLPLTSLVFAAGLAGLAFATGPWSLFAAWALLGVGMGSGLYEGAFAALVRLYGAGSRGAITGVTLFAGFASTIGWPLSAYLETQVGWRGACLTWAALHIVVGLPLNLWLPAAARLHVADDSSRGAAAAATETSTTRSSAAALLAIVFAITWFISTAMAAHLPALLIAQGSTLAGAVFVGALIGPAQVGARLLEFGVLRHIHPLLSARLAALLHPIGACLLGVLGAPAAAAFGVLHGAGNGILTIAKGTLPLAIFGPSGYGHRQGMLMVPARIAQASAPYLFGLCLERWGAGALWISAVLGMAAFGALALLPKPQTGR
ncbi:MAG: MFS transporter [Pseudomonadota bacterium]|nr:MFS transporter [Pseudomonadota bacterium]